MFAGADGSSTGSLTFDGYEQDQVVQVMSKTVAGKQTAGLVVNDRPLDHSLVDDLEVLDQLPELGPEQQDVLMQDFPPGHFGVRRVFVGTSDTDAIVGLADGKGRPRLRLRVGSDGGAAIEFLDQDGVVTKAIGPDD